MASGPSPSLATTDRAVPPLLLGEEEAEVIIAATCAWLGECLWNDFWVNFSPQRAEIEERMRIALREAGAGMRGSVVCEIVDETIMYGRQEFCCGVAIDACRAVFDPREMDGMERMHDEGGDYDDGWDNYSLNYRHNGYSSAAQAVIVEVLERTGCFYGAPSSPSAMVYTDYSEAVALASSCTNRDEAMLRARMVREARRLRAQLAIDRYVIELEDVLPVWDRLVRREEVIMGGADGVPQWTEMSDEHRAGLERVGGKPNTLRKEAVRIFCEEMERLEDEGAVVDFYFSPGSSAANIVSSPSPSQFLVVDRTF